MVFSTKQRTELHRLKHRYEDEPEDTDGPHFVAMDHAKHLCYNIPRLIKLARNDIESGDYDSAMGRLHAIAAQVTSLSDDLGSIRRQHGRRKKQLAEKAARRLHGVKTGPLNVRTIAPTDPSNRLLKGIEGVKKPMKAKKNRGERILERGIRRVI